MAENLEPVDDTPAPRVGSLVRVPGDTNRVGIYLGGDDPAGPVVLWFAGVAAPYGADLEPVA